MGTSNRSENERGGTLDQGGGFGRMDMVEQDGKQD